MNNLNKYFMFLFSEDKVKVLSHSSFKLRHIRLIPWNAPLVPSSMKPNFELGVR